MTHYPKRWQDMTLDEKIEKKREDLDYHEQDLCDRVESREARIRDLVMDFDHDTADVRGLIGDLREDLEAMVSRRDAFKKE